MEVSGRRTKLVRNILKRWISERVKLIETVVQRGFVKKVTLKVSQNSQKKTASVPVHLCLELY